MGLAKRIIPCLDVAAGRVVKGVNFVNLRDAGDPVEVARRYDEQGADEIAFLDIRASIETRGLLYGMIEAVAQPRRDALLGVLRADGGKQPPPGGDVAGRRGHLDAVVERRQIRRVRPAARVASAGHARFVDLRAGEQVVERRTFESARSGSQSWTRSPWPMGSQARAT